MSDDESTWSYETLYASDSDSELCELERLGYLAVQKEITDGYEEALSRLRLSMTCRELAERAVPIVPRIIGLARHALQHARHALHAPWRR